MSARNNDATCADNFKETCPYCAAECDCDLVDIGVGYVQAGPFHCEVCGAIQAGPYDDKPDDLARIDRSTGWFRPGDMPGSSANMIDGRLASAEETRAAYHARFSGSPDYHEVGAVEDWFASQKSRP